MNIDCEVLGGLVSLQWRYKRIVGVPSWLLLEWTLGIFLKSWSFASCVSNISSFVCFATFLLFQALADVLEALIVAASPLPSQLWGPGLPGEGAFLLPSSSRESPGVLDRGAFMGLHGWWGIASQSRQFGIPTNWIHHGDVVSLPWWGKSHSIHGFRWNYTNRGRDELGVPSQFSEAAAAILLAASENSERGGKGVEGEDSAWWALLVVQKYRDSAGFIFHSCKLNNLKNWTNGPMSFQNHGSQVRRNTNDLQLERKGSSCTGPMVQWRIPQREEGDDLPMLKQETGICPVDGDINSMNQSGW